MGDGPFREEVYAGSWPEAGLVNSLLEREGIVTIVANARMKANLPAQLSRAVYVLSEAQVARAREIVARYRDGQPIDDPKSYRSWRCVGCNELVAGQFDVCWKCGAGKP